MRWLAIALFFASPAAAVTCEDVDYQDNSYSVCHVDATTETLRLFHSDDAGDVLGSFGAVDATLGDENLAFAMNAGMYHADRAPVGHYVEDGIEKMGVITTAGPGNFGLLPNGVFCISNGQAQVFETLTYVDQDPTCDHATQSGPMLVIDGALHPRFIPNGLSRFKRNGVGTTADGTTAMFVISNNAVSFHAFGSFFKDYLDLPNALYFDGKVSRLYAPDLGRSDIGFQLGPIVGVVE